MTTETTTHDNPIADQICAVMYRHKMNQMQMAEYLAVPQTTISNWINGKRKPSAGAARLLYVLGMMEALAPGVHATLIPPKGEPRTRTRAVPVGDASDDTEDE